jgi:hypothetical protein
MPVLSSETVQSIFNQLGLRFQFSAEELAGMTTTNVVSAERILTFPTPAANEGLNLLNLRRLLGVDPQKPPSFFDHPWYLEEQFGYLNCEPGWHSLQMDVHPESVEKPVDYIRNLASEGLTLPTAIEVVLMLFLHFAGTGERLLLKKHTWCRDEASLGRVVTVGAFGRNGVFISGHPPTFASRGLGICGKLNLPQTGALSR